MRQYGYGRITADARGWRTIWGHDGHRGRWIWDNDGMGRDLVRHATDALSPGLDI
jgi:hypothetical protein